MSIDELSPEEVDAKQAALLEKIPPTGAIGNKALRERLEGWPDDLYWAIRNRLIERGTLETGRGKGGSVKRVAATPPDVEQAAAETPGARETKVTEGGVVTYTRPISDVRAKIAKRGLEELGLSFAEIARHVGVNTSSIRKAVVRLEEQ